LLEQVGRRQQRGSSIDHVSPPSAEMLASARCSPERLRQIRELAAESGIGEGEQGSWTMCPGTIPQTPKVWPKIGGVCDAALPQPGAGSNSPCKTHRGVDDERSVVSRLTHYCPLKQVIHHNLRPSRLETKLWMLDVGPVGNVINVMRSPPA